MADVSIGEVIFTSIKPLTKIVAIAATGAIFARKGILDVATCRSNASVVVNGFMPLLIFASTISSFSLHNISEAGVVLLSAAFFTGFGFIFGFLIRILTPVGPWKNGVIACNAWSNNGDVVIGIVSTLSQTKPFNGAADYAKGVSYASIFMVFTFLTLYSMGGIQFIQHDFNIRRVQDPESGEIVAIASTQVGEKAKSLPSTRNASIHNLSQYDEKGDEEVQASQTTIIPKEHVIADVTTRMKVPLQPVSTSAWANVLLRVKLFITVPTVTLLLALVIGIVPQLRALFVQTDGVNMPNAPDGRSPLDFVIQFASYGGAASPVLGLAMLGAALSRIRIGQLPKGFWISVVSTCVLKLIVGPILGIVWIQALKNHTSLIKEDQKMMQLVIAVTGAMPAATSQVYITSMFAPDESPIMSCLSAMLLAHYALMIIMLPVVVSYTLLVVL